ncbi:unnamed protein product, partial [Rotaria sp. Silwood1]
MNADRLNNNLSPKHTTRRNIFSTEPITNNQQQQQISSSFTDQHKKISPTLSIEHQSFSSSSSSSSSSSPQPPPQAQTQQSFNSDTSIIDRSWLEQQRIRNANTHCVLPSTLHDPS